MYIAACLEEQKTFTDHHSLRVNTQEQEQKREVKRPLEIVVLLIWRVVLSANMAEEPVELERFDLIFWWSHLLLLLSPATATIGYWWVAAWPSDSNALRMDKRFFFTCYQHVPDLIRWLEQYRSSDRIG